MVITIVMQDSKLYRFGNTGSKFMWKIYEDDSVLVLEIHKAAVKHGRHVFNDVIFVLNIIDYILLMLDLTEQHKFQFD